MDESTVHLPSLPPPPSIQVRGRKWRENENGMETFFLHIRNGLFGPAAVAKPLTLARGCMGPSMPAPLGLESPPRGSKPAIC